MRKTLPIQEQQLFELFSNFTYKLPKDPELILYDFYFLTSFGKEIAGRNMNANYAIQEASDMAVDMLHVHMKDAVFYAVCAEIRHLFDYYTLDGVDKRISKDQLEFLQEYFKEYSMLNNIQYKAGYLGIDYLIKASERDRKILSQESTGNRMASYKAVKAVMKRLNWNKSKFAIFAEDVFNSAGWGSSYGGKPWAGIAEALYKLERAGKKSDKIIWIDHAYDLQHNTDTVFNKLKLYYKDGGYGWIKKALDWKRDVMEIKSFYNKISTQLRPMVAYISKVTTGKSIISAEDKRKATMKVTADDLAMSTSGLEIPPADTSLIKRPGQKYKFKEGDVVKISDIFYHITPDNEIIEWADSQNIVLGEGLLSLTDQIDDYKIYAIGEHPKFPNKVVAIIQPMGYTWVYLFYVDGLKKKPMLKLGTQMHDPDETQVGYKFNIGDSVSISDYGETRPNMVEWAFNHGFNITKGAVPNFEHDFQVYYEGQYDDTIFYIIKSTQTNQNYVIGEKGLKLVIRSSTIDYKYNVGDTVKVINSNKAYSMYNKWAKDKGFITQPYKTPSSSIVYTIIAKGPHSVYEVGALYGIKDDSGNSYIIGEDGLDSTSDEITKYKFKFKRNDIVKVIDSGECYTSSEIWDDRLNYPITTSRPPRNDHYLIMQSKDLDNEEIYVIKRIGINEYYIIGEHGIEAVKMPSKTFSDNEYTDVSVYGINWTNVKFKTDNLPFVKAHLEGLKWLQNAKIENAHLKLSFNKTFIFENGTWENGTWENGTWESGLWKSGTWENGTWENGTWESGLWKSGTWENGHWKSGLWKSGLWKSGTWKSGEILQDHGHYEYSDRAPE